MMKKTIMITILMIIAGGVSAAVFSDLQTFKVSDVKTAAEQLGSKEAGIAKIIEPVASIMAAKTAIVVTVADRISGGAPYSSSFYSTRAKADAVLQRILQDVKKQGIPVVNQPTVEPQGKYYRFKIVFGPTMYVDSLKSYVMNHELEGQFISAVESGGGVYLETEYDREDGMSVYYVMPEGKQPEEVVLDV